MNVAELIEQLEKVQTKTAMVYVETDVDVAPVVQRVIVEHDMGDDTVWVRLKCC